MVQTSGQDASWTSPWGGVLGMPIRETPGQTKDMMERLDLLAGFPGGVGGNGSEEEHLDFPAQAVAPVTRTWISSKKRNKMK